MQTEIFTLCDAATVSGGKMNVLGSFDSIHAPRFPYRHPLCAVATKLRFEMGEEGEHDFEIAFCDPDMRPIIDPLQLKIKIRIDRLSATHFHVWNLLGFELKEAGAYYFELKVDREIQSRFPLYVAEYRQPTP